MRALAFLLAIGGLLAAEPLTKGERDRAMSHLHGTRKLVVDLVTPLSAEQWSYKPGPDRWSIAECAEHIAETEKLLRGLIQQSLKTLPVDDAKRTSRAAQREESAKSVLTMMTDRSKPASAPNEIRPTGRYATKADALASFLSGRDETIRWVETSPDDFRGRFFKRGPSESDLYEMVLIISGHTERHYLQMKEVAASPGFPKK